MMLPKMAAAGAAALLLGLAALTCDAALPFDPAAVVPAFVWSNIDCVSGSGVVDYQALAMDALATNIFANESQILSGKSVDAVFIFVGTQLRTSDLSRYRGEHEDADPLKALKGALHEANTSISFPSISLSGSQRYAASVLAGALHAKLGKNLGELLTVGPCKVDAGHATNFDKVADLKEHLVERPSKRHSGQTDVLVVCNEDLWGDYSLEALTEEGHIFDAVHQAVKESVPKYTVIYTADPREAQHLSDARRALQEEDSCDALCRTKATVLEVFMVVVVLAIILISGLCCMAQVDTPSRFEKPHDQ